MLSKTSCADEAQLKKKKKKTQKEWSGVGGGLVGVGVGKENGSWLAYNSVSVHTRFRHQTSSHVLLQLP